MIWMLLPFCNKRGTSSSVLWLLLCRCSGVQVIFSLLLTPILSKTSCESVWAGVTRFGSKNAISWCALSPSFSTPWASPEKYSAEYCNRILKKVHVVGGGKLVHYSKHMFWSHQFASWRDCCDHQNQNIGPLSNLISYLRFLPMSSEYRFTKVLDTKLVNITNWNELPNIQNLLISYAKIEGN